MCHRLDALEANGFPDALEEAEVATLRVMISVSCSCLHYKTYIAVDKADILCSADCLAETARKTTHFRTNFYWQIIA